jgi:phenylalanyl-tRNA synthetase beta chain
VLTSLGCTVAGEWAPGLYVTPPWWRPDLRIPDDLAEEVARILGYDALPTTTVRGAIPHMPHNAQRELRERLRDLLVGAGMQEVLTYPLTSLANLQRLAPHPSVTNVQPMSVANPMSSEQEYLRTSLRPGLLTTLVANERTSPGKLQLFEIGRVYLPRPGDLPDEQEWAAAVVSGEASDAYWAAKNEPAAFGDARGIVEGVLAQLGAAAAFTPMDDANLYPGRAAAITVGGAQVGVLGEVRQDVLDRFDSVSRPVYLFELDIAALASAGQARRAYQPLSRYPGVTEDLAVIVRNETPAGDIEAAILGAALVSAVRLFDVYQGAPVPEGHRSLAYSITYQAADHTLRAEEVAKVRAGLLKQLGARFGARLRA